MAGEPLKALNYMNGVAGSVLTVLCGAPVAGLMMAIGGIAQGDSLTQALRFMTIAPVLFGAVAAPVTLVAGTVLGVPVAYVLNRMGQYRGVWMLVAGALLGPVVFEAVRGTVFGFKLNLLSVFWGVLFGGTAAIGFWWGSRGFPTR